MKKVMLLPVLFFAMMLLPGCFKKRVRLTCSSYADRSALPYGFTRDKTFSITGKKCDNQVEQKDTLQTKEMTNKIAATLRNKGYRVEESKKADYAIQFNYGTDSRTKNLNVAKYVPGQTSTTTAHANIYGNTDHRYDRSYHDVRADAVEQTTTSGSIVYVPEEHTFHTKSLQIDVRDTKEKDSPLAWECLTEITDENSDFRAYCDYLIVKSLQWFGKNTHAENQSDLYEDDPELVDLRHAYY